MKTDKLVDAIGMIDDEYVKEAHEDKKKERKPFKLPDFHLSWALMGKLATAGICLFLAVSILPNFFHSYKASKSDSAGAYYENSTYEPSYYAAPAAAASGNGLYYEDSAVEVYDDEMSYAPQSEESKPAAEPSPDPENDRKQDKKLILTAVMKMETQDIDETTRLLSEGIAKYEGYVQKSSSYTRNSSTRVYEATIRIPSDKYADFLKELGEAGNTVSYNDEIEDVTDSYTDIVSRINALRAQADKVMEFYEKAETIEDLMSIESRLSDLQYQIERYEAQIKNYDLLTAYSTLYITITETKVYTPSNPNFFERLASSFKDGWHDFMDGFGDFLIDVVYNIWTILLLAALGYLAYRIYRRIRNRKNQK